jgi:hypothetical protein
LRNRLEYLIQEPLKLKRISCFTVLNNYLIWESLL